MTAFLDIADLSKRFGGLTAVNHVSFSLGRGEVAALLGPNGSGKTTVLNMISGLLPVSGGTITLAGRRLTGLPAHRIAHAGVARTFQLVRVMPSLSVTENILAAILFRTGAPSEREGREEAQALLAEVGLDGRGAEAAASLTYIDQKRMELARALAARPQLLLLDEWLAGLNPSELRIGIDLIARLNARGITILLVEHVMDAVRALCPRSVVMNAGKTLADGATADVLRDPEVVRAYLGAAHAVS
ncbi:ABC transporter ATP-binding protein [Polymorphum gilvum]|uniref:ABC transporter related protein n=1 Tax=Polymorphum gilvum (strain LMG 25793 / CGMCC 1.9160 / SL003B-26A1) TaxID=991905 RepID=F2IWW9_POLGS|nr:ABC transporter ATP-binding protein [Polymorphum gilvum]ADZ71546.1 ABC transporter related protein [Polymorphum gilvum SL003B-26A1]